MNAKIYISPKEGILDPQGKAVEHALTVLGFEGVKGVRIGKYMEISLTPGPIDQIKKSVEAMCEKLLANTVIESYRYELDSEDSTSDS
ncbi:MAG: phosphoribosylformylglycinamidine synthase subunit PurS [Nitrospiria bacterium]